MAALALPGRLGQIVAPTECVRYDAATAADAVGATATAWSCVYFGLMRPK